MSSTKLRSGTTAIVDDGVNISFYSISDADGGFGVALPDGNFANPVTLKSVADIADGVAAQKWLDENKPLFSGFNRNAFIVAPFAGSASIAINYGGGAVSVYVNGPLAGTDSSALMPVSPTIVKVEPLRIDCLRGVQA